MKSGAIDGRIKRLKYQGKLGWATIFGRVVLGYLEAHRAVDEFDLIVPNPTFVGAGSTRTVRHTELVLEAAATEDLFADWPFDDLTSPSIIKLGPTPSSAGGGYHGKVAAADALLSVLRVLDPERVRGARVLVFDDICTTGHQLDRVAQVLKTQGGAAHVEGLVLARSPWRRR